MALALSLHGPAPLHHSFARLFVVSPLSFSALQRHLHALAHTIRPHIWLDLDRPRFEYVLEEREAQRRHHRKVLPRFVQAFSSA